MSSEGYGKGYLVIQRALVGGGTLLCVGWCDRPIGRVKPPLGVERIGQSRWVSRKDYLGFEKGLDEVVSVKRLASGKKGREEG